MKSTLILFLAACLFVGCGDGSKKAKAQTPPPTHIITAKGVGTLTLDFQYESERKLEGYNVDTIAGGDPNYLIVTDMDGKVVIRKEVELYEVMNIYSPLFKTVEGIGVGSTIGEMLKYLGKWGVGTYASLEEGEQFVFYSTTPGNNFSFYVHMGQLKEPSKREDFSNNPAKLTEQDFKSDAKVVKVKIEQIYE